MTPLRRNRWQHKRRLASERGRKMGLASQRVQRERRMLDLPDRLRELAEIEIQNLPRKQGDALGCLQWHDFRTGKVTRWVACIGDRRDRVILRSPDGRCSKSHGWAWCLDRIRRVILGTATPKLRPPPSDL